VCTHREIEAGDQHTVSLGVKEEEEEAADLIKELLRIAGK
jgi:hypothetical protein